MGAVAPRATTTKYALPGSSSLTVISTPTPPVTAEGKPEANEGAALSLVENWSFTTFSSP